MSSGPELVIVFKLRNRNLRNEALHKIEAGVKKYRGFYFLEKKDTILAMGHQGYEFNVYSLESLWSDLSNPDQDIVILLADAKQMLDDDGENDADFWKAYQNAIALVVAEIDPYYGIITDTETIKDIVKEGLDKNPINMNYFSFDYIRERLPGCNTVIQKYASRKLKYGFLVTDMILPENQWKKYNQEMKSGVCSQLDYEKHRRS